MSVRCQCVLIGCVGFDPDEEDRCPRCPFPLRTRLIVWLRRLVS